jgi:hypothetical protein
LTQLAQALGLCCKPNWKGIKVWKFILSLALSFFLVAGTGSELMADHDGPDFAVGSEEILTGNQPEFSKCEAFKTGYLTGIAGTTKLVSYSFNEKWGYIMRVLYSAPNKELHSVEMGTLVCWRPRDKDVISFSVDVKGSEADLIPNRRH